MQETAPQPPDQELWVLLGALTPTVKSLDRFLLFSENVADPGNLTNFGVLLGFCGVLRNPAGAGGTRPGDVLPTPCVRGPRSPGSGGLRLWRVGNEGPRIFADCYGVITPTVAHFKLLT